MSRRKLELLGTLAIIGVIILMQIPILGVNDRVGWIPIILIVGMLLALYVLRRKSADVEDSYYAAHPEAWRHEKVSRLVEAIGYGSLLVGAFGSMPLVALFGDSRWVWIFTSACIVLGIVCLVWRRIDASIRSGKILRGED